MPKIKTRGHIHPTLTGYQFADGVDSPERPLRSIRLKCLECCCGNVAEVRRCHITDCTLWPWRMGKRPTDESIADTRTPEQREAAECYS